MIFIAGRLWDHFLMILEVAKKREEKEERQDRWRKIQEYEQSYFGSSNKSRRSAVLRKKMSKNNVKS